MPHVRRFLLVVSCAVPWMGCGHRDPGALVAAYVRAGAERRYDLQYGMVLPSLRKLEPREAYVEYQSRLDRVRGRVLAHWELVNAPPADGREWRAFLKLKWAYADGRGETVRRGLTLVRRGWRWWVVDTPSARQSANEAYMAGQFAEATRRLYAILRINPSDAETWDLLGYVLRDNPVLKNALELAIDAHRQAVRLEPANPDWRVSLGNDYRQLGWYGGAAAELRKAASLEPRASTYVWLGAASAAAGQLGAARSAWHRAIELDPENAQAHAFLEKTK